MDFDQFFDAYVAAALWSSTDDDEEPLDNKYNIRDIAGETFDEMRADCERFIDQNKDLLDGLDYQNGQYSTDELAGHDFWLTRNGHGAGFWDRGLGKLGDQLTEASKLFGEFNLYVGDDGQIYGV